MHSPEYTGKAYLFICFEHGSPQAQRVIGLGKEIFIFTGKTNA